MRWWDGAVWTEHARDAEGVGGEAGPRPTLVYTPWIWLIAVLPALANIPLYFLDLSKYIVVDPSTGAANRTAMFALYTDPVYLTAILTGWLVYGVMVVMAFLDRRALMAAGHSRTFHWAWAFLAAIVYVIGRSVMVRRQTGRGFAPMWVVIAVTVANVIGGLVWVFSAVISMLQTTIPG